jgi:predicted phosphodiesterase
MAKTLKAQIVLEYLEKYPKTHKRTLAEMIYRDNVEVFNKIESVRSMIRYYTGASGVRDRNKISKKYPKHIKMGKLGNPFELPESEEQSFDPFVIQKVAKKVLILSDIHCPYHSIQALSQAINYGKEKGVDSVILNGDIIDFYQASSFCRDPRKKSIKYELDTARELLIKIKESLGNPKMYYKQGNHEERFERYLLVKAPELLGIEEFKLDVLLRFGELGIEYIDKKRIIKAGKLNVMHGHEFGRAIFSPVNPARGAYMKAKENCIVGHHHQTSEHTEPSLSGIITTTWSVGCLSELHPEYAPINKYNHGFAYVELSKDGTFKVENKRINNGDIL